MGEWPTLGAYVSSCSTVIQVYMYLVWAREKTTTKQLAWVLTSGTPSAGRQTTTWSGVGGGGSGVAGWSGEEEITVTVSLMNIVTASSAASSVS